MKIQFWSVGKSNEKYVKEGIEVFTKRINHYFAAEWKILSSPRDAAQLPIQELKVAEAKALIKILQPNDVLVVLDEKGKQFTSEQLAMHIQKKANESVKNLIFIIGGAYGVDESVLKRADIVWSLSSLVFPHQLVRLILAEQIYRACTILRNENYHHS